MGVNPIRRVMTSDAHRPFTLWFDTLPSGDTARLLIWPRPEPVRVVLFWNRVFHSVRGFTSRETAEASGYALHDILRQDARAGALLGCDRDVGSIAHTSVLYADTGNAERGIAVAFDF